MDLISREAAQCRITEMIECVTNGDDGYYVGEKNALWHVEREIKKLPSVPAVPLDKLCEWLAERYEPPYTLIDIDKLKAPIDFRQQKEIWLVALTKWMEEQDAQKEN